MAAPNSWKEVKNCATSASRNVSSTSTMQYTPSSKHIKFQAMLHLHSQNASGNLTLHLRKTVQLLPKIIQHMPQDTLGAVNKTTKTENANDILQWPFGVSHLKLIFHSLNAETRVPSETLAHAASDHGSAPSQDGLVDWSLGIVRGEFACSKLFSHVPKSPLLPTLTTHQYPPVAKCGNWCHMVWQKQNNTSG